jgi:cytochrome b subunit of formate dehydrogenase
MEMPSQPTEVPSRPPEAAAHVQRFDRLDVALHGLLMVSFLGLSLTGLPLLFAHRTFAARMARLIGGYAVTGVLHRLFATLLILTFLAHLGRVLRRVLGGERRLLWGPDSLVPQPKDVLEMAQHFRYFLGLGQRPRFGRFTYWEKFDYWAVFWGMGIIGLSGLVLWFPRAFALLMPGWAFNVAFVIHGEEALLAVVFIFTVHFFNGHLRPEKFPMDVTIFTGRTPLEEYEQDHPADSERLRREGDRATFLAGPPSLRRRRLGYVIGTAAVALGLTLVGLTVYALLTS